MAKSPLFDPASPVTYSCAVSGAEKLRPRLDPAAVCNLFKRQIEAEIARQTRAAPAFPARGQAIRVAVRIVGPREASASAEFRARGKLIKRPEITLDVMDKSLGMRDLESLASQLSRSITQP
ncbi:hypothetical protein [Novosphingobium sp.]|uniref:hypothetical protein n=1 Tax=Novosphingobium sp. TaxID=1874826 RepID=UPI002CDFE6DF|nr:hypothetical protein [Novosphingobium sp.]HQV04924.1 hypothetical protein [Novosphingobium sp.]